MTTPPAAARSRTAQETSGVGASESKSETSSSLPAKTSDARAAKLSERKRRS
jgi:hypothetical protein